MSLTPPLVALTRAPKLQSDAAAVSRWRMEQLQWRFVPQPIPRPPLLHRGKAKHVWNEASGRRRGSLWRSQDLAMGATRSSGSSLRAFSEKKSDLLQEEDEGDKFMEVRESSLLNEKRERDEGKEEDEGSVVAAVGLIVGSAVGPGILGLPAATRGAGLLPSTVAILLAWVYVISSILLVAELACAVMAERGGTEVTFSGLAEVTLGPALACLTATVYAALNYALLVACISGLGEVISTAAGGAVTPALGCAISAALALGATSRLPFSLLDASNRALVAGLLASSALLLVLGLPRADFSHALSAATWHPMAVLPSLPVVVLTLGFHVITPLLCHVLRGNPQRARRAVLLGGAVPLLMVLSWNAVVLGLAPPAGLSSEPPLAPLALILSLGGAAAPAVQAFAFTALATTLLGYALSFPQQLADTVAMWMSTTVGGPVAPPPTEGGGEGAGLIPIDVAILLALGPPLLLALTCPTVFATALNFAGIYANSFLFGVLPPVMACAYRSRARQRHGGKEHTRLVPGGTLALVALSSVAVFLALWPSPKI